MVTARIAGEADAGKASPRWLAGYRLAPEFGVYLGQVLRSSWPRLRWDLTDDIDALRRWQVDAWLVASPAHLAATMRPVLWIRSPARGPRWYRSSPGRWCMPAPVLAPQLYACVRDIVVANAPA